jgi:hypothetical protein
MPTASGSLMRVRVHTPGRISPGASGSTSHPRSRNPEHSTRTTVLEAPTPASLNRPSASVAVTGPPAGTNTRAPVTGRPCWSRTWPVSVRSGWSRVDQNDKVRGFHTTLTFASQGKRVSRWLFRLSAPETSPATWERRTNPTRNRGWQQLSNDHAEEPSACASG